MSRTLLRIICLVFLTIVPMVVAAPNLIAADTSGEDGRWIDNIMRLCLIGKGTTARIDEVALRGLLLSDKGNITLSDIEPIIKAVDKEERAEVRKSYMECIREFYKPSEKNSGGQKRVSVDNFVGFKTIPASAGGYRASVHPDVVDKGFKVIVEKTKQDKDWGIQVIGADDIKLEKKKKYVIAFEYMSDQKFTMGFSIHPEGQSNPEWLVENHGVAIYASGTWMPVTTLVTAEDVDSVHANVFHFKFGMAPKGTQFHLRNLEIRGIQ